LVVDQTLTIVFSDHGVVLASSAQPPQMSTTVSPSTVTETDAPTSLPLSIVLLSSSPSLLYSGSDVP
jgi:hypothetical protein